jgi:hypothetical protein
MRTRLSLFKPSVLSLGAAIAASAVSVSPANAQTTTLTASTTLATSTSSLTTTTATGASVVIAGIVSGAPESVIFSGLAQLNANVVTDPDFGSPPIVVLSIDLGGVTGIGRISGRKYVIEDEMIVQRALAAADSVTATFPFHPSGSSAMSPRLGSASFSLSFDVIGLKLTGASGAIASP